HVEGDDERELDARKQQGVHGQSVLHAADRRRGMPTALERLAAFIDAPEGACARRWTRVWAAGRGRHVSEAWRHAGRPRAIGGAITAAAASSRGRPPPRPAGCRRPTTDRGATAMSQPEGDELLLHELRNRLNLLGFALHAYRRDGDRTHLEDMAQAYEAAVELVARLDASRRAGVGEEPGQGLP